MSLTYKHIHRTPAPQESNRCKNCSTFQFVRYMLGWFILYFSLKEDVTPPRNIFYSFQLLGKANASIYSFFIKHKPVEINIVEKYKSTFKSAEVHHSYTRQELVKTSTL